MERGASVVGVLATLSVALAAGALASASPAASGAGGVGIGGVGAAARALGGVLWLVASGALVAGGAWAAIDRVRGAGGASWSSSRVAGLALAVAAGILGVLAVAIRVFEDGDGPRRQDGVGGPLLQGAPESASTTTGPGPAIVLGVLLALFLVVLVALAYRRLDGERDDARSDDADAAGETSEGRSEAEGRDALGSAAGRAADHLADADVPPANDVVAAWRELASVLSVSRPASSTPREFADAAVDAGVDEADVAELTALFEAVRYGDRDADAERTRRAVAALERIKDQHGEGGER